MDGDCCDCVCYIECKCSPTATDLRIGATFVHTSEMSQPSYELTAEQRAAAEHLADSDNPLSSVATVMCYLDDRSAASSTDDASSSRTASAI